MRKQEAPPIPVCGSLREKDGGPSSSKLEVLRGRPAALGDSSGQAAAPSPQWPSLWQSCPVSGGGPGLPRCGRGSGPRLRANQGFPVRARACQLHCPLPEAGSPVGQPPSLQGAGRLGVALGGVVTSRQLGFGACPMGSVQRPGLLTLVLCTPGRAAASSCRSSKLATCRDPRDFP